MPLVRRYIHTLDLGEHVLGFLSWFKKKHPVITPQMIEPVEAQLSLTDAKKMYRKIMLELKHLDREEVSDHVQYLSDDVKETLNAHKEDIAQAKDEIRELKGKLKLLQKSLKEEIDPDRKEEIELEIEDWSQDVEFAEEQIQETELAYSKLKADKREFLVDYLNQELHGTNWKENGA